MLLTDRRAIVIDMRSVQGMDASALIWFRKLRQLCQPHQIALVFAGLDEKQKQRALLRRCEGLDKPEFDFIDLDHALEWIKARTLNEFGGVPTEASLRTMLVHYFHPQNLERSIFCSSRLFMKRAKSWLAQGERGDSLLFIERGQLGVKLAPGSGADVRISLTVDLDLAVFEIKVDVFRGAGLTLGFKQIKGINCCHDRAT